MPPSSSFSICPLATFTCISFKPTSAVLIAYFYFSSNVDFVVCSGYSCAITLDAYDFLYFHISMFLIMFYPCFFEFAPFSTTTAFFSSEQLSMFYHLMVLNCSFFHNFRIYFFFSVFFWANISVLSSYGSWLPL